MNTKKATKTVYPLLREIVNLIPAQIVHEAAAKANVKSRSFTPWSHLLALIHQQLSKTESLNGVCDAARIHESQWSQLRDAQCPRRNTFSNANRRRNPLMAEKVFWDTFEHLKSVEPGFANDKPSGYLARFKNRNIPALDSSTIRLTLKSFDWARHRRQKAAAKLHMQLDVGNRLPSFAVVESAGHHDSTRAEEVTANLKDGDTLVADRAYTDFSYMNSLSERRVFFVMRQKRNMRMTVDSSREVEPEEGPADRTTVLKDEIVHPGKKRTAELYRADDGKLRRVTARVEVDGRMMEMEFLTNNFSRSARSIAELYKARWTIEVFFKELKQTCQIHDFVGYNENAVKWQIWVGLLVHLLLRYLRYLAKWKLSFSRLAGVVRSGIWVKRKVVGLLELYGTAGNGNRTRLVPRYLYCQPFLKFTSCPMGQQT